MTFMPAATERRGARAAIPASLLVAVLTACGGPLVGPRDRPTDLRLAAAPAFGAISDNVVVLWDSVALQAVRATHPGPPIVARALAILHTAIFDAWAAYSAHASGTRFGAALRRPRTERTIAHKAEAVSYAAYRALVDLFPSQQAQFVSEMALLGYDPANASTDATTPVGIGNITAQAVLDFRHHDGSNQLGDINGGAPYSDYTGYAPVNTPDQILNPNRWQPLRVPDGHGGFVVQQFIAPQWERVTPFALTSPAEFLEDAAPAIYPSDGYADEVTRILEYSANLTDREKAIAEYWRDGPHSETPPGHWCLFATFISRRDHHGIGRDATMFFAMTSALLDASIASWHAKRYFDSVRPITAVHFLKAGQLVRAWAGPGRGTQLIPAETWQPFQPAASLTPPFPEFFSGHSVFSAAAATVLAAITGSDAFGASATLAAGSSQVEPGITPANDVTLSWGTFSDAADQAGLSRRYGGIHFVSGDLTGRRIGRRIGAQAWAQVERYVDPDHESDPDGDEDAGAVLARR